MLDCIIIGGGLAGLTAAFRLKKAGKHIQIIEKNPWLGGNIRSFRKDSLLMETGPHSFQGSSEYIWRLVSDFDQDVFLQPVSKTATRRYIFRNGRMYPLPIGVIPFLTTPLLSIGSKWRIMMEPFIKNGAQPYESAWEFFCRRFGLEAATYIMGPFTSGIYAGDPKQLGARAAFPKFWNFENDAGSMIRGAFRYMKEKKRRLKSEGLKTQAGIFSFKEGLGMLNTHLGDYLKDQCVTDAQATSIEYRNGTFLVHARHQTYQAASMIVATPPDRSAPLFNTFQPDLAAMFLQIPMAPALMIHWTIPPETHTYPPGFGVLVPRVESVRVLGTIFVSDLFPERSPEDKSLYASIYGGMLDESVMLLDDAEIESMVIRDHEALFGVPLTSSITIHKIIRHVAAIPQLLPHHPEIIERIRETIQPFPGLFLAGNYLTGIGMEHAVMNGYKASDACFNFLR